MDEQGFTEWAVGRQRQLLRSAYLLSGDLHHAEDLVQEALTKVALRWSRLADGNPTAYALRIISRDNISWWRKRRVDDLSARAYLPVRDPLGDYTCGGQLLALTWVDKVTVLISVAALGGPIAAGTRSSPGTSRRARCTACPSCRRARRPTSPAWCWALNGVSPPA